MGRDFLSDMPHNDRKTFLRRLTIYRVKNKKAASIQYSERVKL